MTATARRTFAAALVALTCGAVGFGVAAAPADAATAGAPAPGSGYVALGDSYAAGYGIGTSTGRPVSGCAQSTQDYPHQIAAALKLKLTDVSCSGAVTANIDTTPQVTSAGTAPLQDAVLSATTKLVTVSIGGNDLGFADIAEYCLASSPAGPLVLHPSELNCKAHYAPAGGTDSLAATITNVVVPRVARVLADIHAKAPHAQVYLVDYPAISTTKAASPDPATYPDSCFSPVAVGNSFPFTGVDTAYLQTVEADLDAALATRVRKSGDAFVESYPQSLAHSACAGTAAPWLNGITLDPAAGGTKAGSLHPNLTGATHLAEEALAAIGPYAAPASSPASTVPVSASTAPGSVASTSSESASSSAAPVGGTVSTTAPLADTGSADVRPLVLTGVLLLLSGAGLLLLVRRRAVRHQH